ncbi:GNAT family N-acetyltransferase [Tersicoccus sp. Bi-70]|uniref:GNAT family N-acetyltransferase n=1 Tax=Tersicoccus sp. Bi-70 TaxID=1897634 RepID=UPI00097866D9|nr:GNAT family N-acetyltransferase [Tersicoccus sp. Bi-70]OMH34824.1 hypothetical protein BGP79_00110 [Tersicoccus sp. Bi-70]
MDVTTERLTLHPLTRDEAVARAAADIPAEERWGTGYPVVDQRSALTSFVEMWDEVGDTRPFGVYDVCERETGDQVGGVAFFGPPSKDGVVEFGYGLVPGARGRGYAKEAVSEALRIAREAGARTVKATTTPDNIASQAVMLRAGMREVRRAGRLVYFQIDFDRA